MMYSGTKATTSASGLSPCCPGWVLLERMAADMAQAAPAPVDQHAIWEAEARAEAEEVYRQILEEKKAEAGYSASPPDSGGVA